MAAEISSNESWNLFLPGLILLQTVNGRKEIMCYMLQHIPAFRCSEHEQQRLFSFPKAKELMWTTKLCLLRVLCNPLNFLLCFVITDVLRTWNQPRLFFVLSIILRHVSIRKVFSDHCCGWIEQFAWSNACHTSLSHVTNL